MEIIDQDQAERVWQRVRGEPARDGLQRVPGLIAMEQEDEFIFRQLARRHSQDSASVFIQLSRQAGKRKAVLQGICLITSLHAPAFTSPSIPKDISAALHWLLERKKQAIGHYDALARDPEFGQVFLLLSRQARENLLALLELTGSLWKR